MVIANKKDVHQALVTYVKDQIDFSQVDMRDIIVRYPALDVTIAEKEDNQFVLEFVKDVIKACVNTEVFMAAPDHPIECILSKANPIFPKLRMIGLFSEGNTLNKRDAKEIWSKLRIAGEEQESKGEIIVVSTFSVSASKNVHWICEVIETSKRPFSLYLIDSNPGVTKPTIEINSLMTGDITRLCFYQSCFLFSGGGIHLCKGLTHLVFAGHGKDIDKSILTDLCKAMGDDHLPKLCHLSFSGCESSLKGKMQYLFKKPWPILSHLDVTRCFLDKNDVQIIFAAADDNLTQHSLPKLSSLAISPKYLEVDENFQFLKNPWTVLKCLEMSRAVPYFHPSMREKQQHYRAYPVVMDALIKGRFPNLEHLGAFECLPEQFKDLEHLKSLKLSNGRSGYDSMSLDVKQLSEEFPVSNLEQIDLSHSQLSSNLAHLMCHTFPYLESLILRSCGLLPDSGNSIAQANASSRIPELRHLDLSGNSCSSIDLFEISSPWKELQILHTSEDFYSWATTFQKMAEMVRSECLPKLEEIHVNDKHHRDYNECRSCRQPPEHVLRMQIEQKYRYDNPQYNSSQLTIRDLFTSIADNLPMLKPSSLEGIYIYSHHFFSFEPDGAHVEKQKIRSKNITIDFIKLR